MGRQSKMKKERRRPAPLAVAPEGQEPTAAEMMADMASAFPAPGRPVSATGEAIPAELPAELPAEPAPVPGGAVYIQGDKGISYIGKIEAVSPDGTIEVEKVRPVNVSAELAKVDQLIEQLQAKIGQAKIAHLTALGRHARGIPNIIRDRAEHALRQLTAYRAKLLAGSAPVPRKENTSDE